MNNFLAVYKRDNFNIDLSSFSNHLVAEPTETQIWNSKDNRVLFASYTIRPQTKTNNFIADEESVFTFEGFPLLNTKEEKHFKKSGSESYESILLNSFKRYGTQTFDHIIGEYCAAAYTNKELHIGANLGGSHGLYYTVNEHLVAFSNRSSLLLQLPYVSDAIDTQSSAWKAYQGYISGTGTPFKDIQKAPIGSIFTINSRLEVNERKTTYKDLNQDSIKEEFETNPLKAYENHFDEICDYMHRFKKHYSDLKFDVPLSGGKDSRLILALLIKAGLKDDIQKIWTRGTLYSPEVLSSQEVCNSLNLAPPEIHRPAVVSETNVSAALIINTQNYLEGNLSTYDFQGISNYKHITMQGHQIALRDGAFTKCRTDSLDSFLKDAIAARMHDPLEILNQKYSDITVNKFKSIFSDYHIKEGAPLHDLGDLYYLRDRLLNWASPYCNAQYYSGPLSNPLLLGNLFKFSFSIPYELRSHEIFHYLGIKYCAPDCLNIPFANQEWRESIGGALKQIGINNSILPAPPFKSHRDFPDLANPYVSSIKVDYYNAMKEGMTDLAHKHKANLSEYMNVDKFTAQLKSIDKPTFRELYCAKGVYSDLLIREYGTGIFDRSASKEIIEDLDSRITRPVMVSVDNSNKQEEEAYGSIIIKHEESIASLVKEVQSRDKLLQDFEQKKKLKIKTETPFRLLKKKISHIFASTEN